MYVCAREGQRVVSAPLELELKVAEGAGNDPMWFAGTACALLGQLSALVAYLTHQEDMSPDIRVKDKWLSKCT